MISVKSPAVAEQSDLADAVSEADRTGTPPTHPAAPVFGSDAVAPAALSDAAPEEPPASVVSRLGDAVVAGLMHCACSHQPVHPDLIDLVNGETPPVVPPHPGPGEDDAI